MSQICSFKKILLIACISLLSINALAEKHHTKTPVFKSHNLTDNIIMLQGQGGNIAILKGDQGLLMVDDDYKAMSDVLKKQLKQYGGTDNLSYIINTHWHGDHTQGNLALGNHAAIIAHDNVRTRLLTSQEIKLFKMISKPYPKHALPSITYQKSLTLHINKEEVELIHFSNGHTDGDSIIFFKNANVVHMGDHFFSGFFPFVDVDSGGNVLQMAKNVKSVLGMIKDDVQIIPGHGPLSTKKDLQNFHDMLIGTSAEVQSMKDKGMPLVKIQEKGLSEKWQPWTKGFLSTDAWVGIIYASL